MPKLTPAYFAENEYLDREIYTALAATETNAEFKDILLEFAEHEQKDFAFWSELSGRHDFRLVPGTRLLYRIIRNLFGLTFTVKFLEGGEHRTALAYEKYLATVSDPRVREQVTQSIAHEREHERRLMEQIEAHSVSFMSNVVLGVNDGIVELTGALSGFAFAFGSATVVGLAGTITGIAATLSMSASAYLQAEHDEGKNPFTAALATGGAYLVVVVLLVSPFFLSPVVMAALTATFIAAFVIIMALSFYSSVLLERPFWRQFGLMLLFSFGTAFIAYMLGSWFRSLTGIAL